MKTGADISHHQRTFDAKRYKDSGEDFIILKATEGTQFTSRTFASRWRDAGARNLPRGAYHFARPGGAVNPQADHFIEVVQAAGFRAGDLGWIERCLRAPPGRRLMCTRSGTIR